MQNSKLNGEKKWSVKIVKLISIKKIPLNRYPGELEICKENEMEIRNSIPTCMSSTQIYVFSCKYEWPMINFIAFVVFYSSFLVLKKANQTERYQTQIKLKKLLSLKKKKKTVNKKYNYFLSKEKKQKIKLRQ